MSVAEKTHWLAMLMRRRARDRAKYATEIPPEHQWMVSCTKAQMPAALIKFCIDEPADALFQWTDDGDNDGNDGNFTIASNAASAIVHLQSLATEHDIEVNMSVWWRRYVRHADANTFYLQKQPPFFRKNSQQHTCVVQPIVKVDEKTKSKPKTKKKRVYTCGVCGMPKKGHVCAGVAAPPIPPSPERASGLLTPPPIPPPYAEEDRDDNDDDERKQSDNMFSSFFRPDDSDVPEQNASRLWRFAADRGAAGYSTKTSTTRQFCSTDIEI